MKKLALFTFISFTAAAIFAKPASDSYRKFLKGNISDKTAAIKDAPSQDSPQLTITGVDFAIANKPLLENDRELNSLAVASILSLPKDAEQMEKWDINIMDKLVSVFRLYEDETVRIAVLDKIEILALNGKTENESKAVQLINGYLKSLNPQDAKSPVTERAIVSIASTGNSESFKILYKGWKNNSFKAFQEQTERSLISLSASNMPEIIKLISDSNTSEILQYLSLAQNSEISQNFKAEIAENALSVAINNTEDMNKISSESIKLQLESLSVIADANWTRAANLAVRYFSLAKDEYENKFMTEEQFITVINSLTKLSSTDTAKTLSSYLAEMNSRAEKNDIPAQNVVLAVIKSLGALGDKSAFDNLLYVTYLSYPEVVKSSARESLAKLKW